MHNETLKLILCTTQNIESNHLVSGNFVKFVKNKMETQWSDALRTAHYLIECFTTENRTSEERQMKIKRNEKEQLLCPLHPFICRKAEQFKLC